MPRGHGEFERQKNRGDCGAGAHALSNLTLIKVNTCQRISSFHHLKQ